MTNGHGQRRCVRLLAAGALVTLVGALACRSEGVWAGAAFRSDGSLQVAAEEPICGCLTLGNRTGNQVFLRSQVRGSTSGAAVLNPNETRRFRFDWAGTRTDDYYIIEADDKDGGDLVMSQVVTMEARPVDCESETCIYDTLLLNVAVEEER